MPYKIERTDKEIDDLLDRVTDACERGTAFRGMTYEEGLRAMFDWLTDDEPRYDPLE